MEPFLLTSKTALSNLSAYEKIRVILGNGSCDLDSAVSALAQGYLDYLDGMKNDGTKLAVIPVMNIPEREYRVKTEVVFFLKRHDIPFALLTFRDQIDLKRLKEKKGITLEIVLVDHHQLPEEDAFLADFVVKVIDHRPQDANWLWPGRTVQLEGVGSCATLVARNLLDRYPEAMDTQLFSLLRGPILIDTCNFSKEADRATSADKEVAHLLETLGQLDLDRSKAFDEIVEAKSDISKLTVDDFLIRDLKIANGVPIVGLPILVEKFLELQDVFDAIKNFSESRNTTVIVFIGLEIRSRQLHRDIAVFSFLAVNPLKDQIVKALTSSTQPSLQLTLIKETNQVNGNGSLLLYAQGNLRVTRKQILPLVRDTVTSANCRC
ncbi:exopolyphosphatase PRUNE1 isoform X1 [Osmia bicornis bicornis]|uniref:exopolyphosphatase PRUNE1 isoform X1 n=2 Tax=Osmia bicornis bicornis TaxID=1437191 RepID=UPI001EAF73B9|nr:exopolyphosphatase PRUNE1 isoform X1 [Osmia bicornis bicornis]